MKGRASRAVYMRLQPSLLSPPSDPEEREKKREQKKLHPMITSTQTSSFPQSIHSPTVTTATQTSGAEKAILHHMTGAQSTNW